MSKRVLITGASGFIGSHLSEYCVERGITVRAFDRYNPNNDYGWLEGSAYKGDIEVVLGDIRDQDSVLNAMKGCDEVYHLAALIGIPYSYISPLGYIRTNVEGTYNVLESARNLGVEQVLITSTSETYGSARYVPIDENHPIVGQSPYSASKIAADQLSISYHRSFGLPVKIVRPFNVYGPRQSARAIIPTVITQILSGIRKIRLGNINPTRDLTFVNDTVRGFLSIADSGELFGEVVNIGMNREISVGDLTGLIARLTGVEVEIEQDQQRVRPGSSEVERLCCDNTRILNSTGWRPEYSLEDGLLETIEWIKCNLATFKTEVYNV